MQEPMVSNASDKKQVKEARKKEARGRDREIEDMRSVLRSREGRRVIWRLLEQCSVFGSVNHSSGSQVYYNVGKQDIGHYLMKEIVETDENKLIEMMRENKEEENV